MGSLAVFAGLCARSERQLDRRLDGQERRGRHRCFTGSSATAGTDHGIPPQTRTPGSRPAIGSGQAVAHRRAFRPAHARRRKHSEPTWRHQRRYAATADTAAHPQLGHLDLLFPPRPKPAITRQRTITSRHVHRAQPRPGDYLQWAGEGRRRGSRWAWMACRAIAVTTKESYRATGNDQRCAPGESRSAVGSVPGGTGTPTPSTS